MLNLEKHLLTNGSQTGIDDDIDLSFLVPTHQDSYVSSAAANPFLVTSATIDLSQLIPKKMGLYIVDLQGETVTSRAVIRKGTIVCMDELTIGGQQFSFYDE